MSCKPVYFLTSLLFNSETTSLFTLLFNIKNENNSHSYFTVSRIRNGDESYINLCVCGTHPFIKTIFQSVLNRVKSFLIVGVALLGLDIDY